MREVLDTLSPDEEVKKQTGFKLEKNTKKPTRKQKVRFILSNRNKGSAERKTSEEAVEIVENLKGSFISSIYTRGSFSAHGVALQEEALQLKRYLNAALAELLEVRE